MLQSVVTLLLSLQLVQVPADEIRSALAHAEALYYGARFTDAIELLERIDDLLGSRADRTEDKLATKLQLALAHIGLNDTTSARTFLVELFAVDPDYRLDPRQFPPKVLELAEQAKGEMKRNVCQIALIDGQKSIASSDPAEVLALIDSLDVACPELKQVADEAAEIAYKAGIEAYRKDDLATALGRFQMAVTLSSHEMAVQYIELTRGKLQIAAGRLALQWQKEFDSRQWRQAAGTYRQIADLPSTEDTVAAMNSAYTKALDALVQSWKQSCSRGDEAGMTAVGLQATSLIPDPDFGKDLRAQMVSCTRPLPVAERATERPALKAAAPGAVACLQMDFAQALVHLKSRVYPEITPQAGTYLRNSRVVVNVKIRINQDGTVTPLEAEGGNHILNEAVTDAVAQWKFSPIRDQSGARCVNTGIIMNLSITNR